MFCECQELYLGMIAGVIEDLRDELIIIIGGDFSYGDVIREAPVGG
jgi:phosphoribosylformylglycinamidine (FGAM) synthase-like amidotransferase family enzyme